MERMTITNALSQLSKGNQPFAQIFEHGQLSVEIYKPEKYDNQQPHDKDEIYIIASGTGHFVCNGFRAEFESGEIIFVPAGAVHRFEDFTEDFVTWVIFFGK